MFVITDGKLTMAYRFKLSAKETDANLGIVWVSSDVKDELSNLIGAIHTDRVFAFKNVRCRYSGMGKTCKVFRRVL